MASLGIRTGPYVIGETAAAAAGVGDAGTWGGGAADPPAPGTILAHESEVEPVSETAFFVHHRPAFRKRKIDHLIQPISSRRTEEIRRGPVRSFQLACDGLGRFITVFRNFLQRPIDDPSQTR